MKKIHLILILPLFMNLISCQKDFLEIKPDQKLLVPTTLTDMQALLDNSNIVNRGIGLNAVAADDYELNNETLMSFISPAERNSYTWKSDIFEGDISSDWNIPYQQVFYANVVLDGLKKITRNNTNEIEYDRIRGSALFIRAFAFYELAQQFAQPYNDATAAYKLGIPLKLSSDVNERPGRGKLNECYKKIVNDLNEAFNLVPVRQTVLTRSGKIAIKALLARIYNSMGNHNQALEASDYCIIQSPGLMDFNNLITTRPRPIASDNVEILYHRFMPSYSFASSLSLNVNPEIIKSYHVDDLRSLIFLRDYGNGNINFKGTYSNTATIFSGLATDEMFLIRAESKAWNNDLNGAMDDLNLLLKTRWRTGKYIPYIASNQKQALDIIIMERRKELISRGTRWADLRRLNQNSLHAKTLVRQLNNQTLTLLPQSLKYTFPIPQNEIDGSGIEQNER
ncbi:RagB/SusD family nutrient uptake outer membrane protein [Pedobacter gandavensis]|uniref:RagB/SusD family nutrient uptake outer membrane protein n=1 Tax=Pedobacter gandavensis TaxID=2679963 RepID=UPI00292DAD0C|nr:RagB/SusD family nutrient uptake outer membrane protein [Pedobacter gandavensis]